MFLIKFIDDKMRSGDQLLKKRVASKSQIMIKISLGFKTFNDYLKEKGRPYSQIDKVVESGTKRSGNNSSSRNSAKKIKRLQSIPDGFAEFFKRGVRRHRKDLIGKSICTQIYMLEGKFNMRKGIQKYLGEHGMMKQKGEYPRRVGRQYGCQK